MLIVDRTQNTRASWDRLFASRDEAPSTERAIDLLQQTRDASHPGMIRAQGPQRCASSTGVPAALSSLFRVSGILV
jgi:hypothetical protein